MHIARQQRDVNEVEVGVENGRKIAPPRIELEETVKILHILIDEPVAIDVVVGL